MQRRSRGASSLRLASCLAPAGTAHRHDAGAASTRIFGGCLLPTPEGLVGAAVGALRQRSDELQPAFLTGAVRAAQLAARRHNSVPESLIVDGITGDPNCEYIKHYAAAATESLAEAGASSGALYRGILSQYWKHLQAVVSGGLRIPEAPPTDCDPSLQVLLRPALVPKLLARTPFKNGAQSARYAAAVLGLRDAVHRLQQYMFFMRPDDPSRRSADTALRLGEILAYSGALYDWAEWMVQTADAQVCRRLDPTGRRCVPPARTAPAPADAFARHLDRGPGGTTGSMQCMALRAAVGDVFGHLRVLAGLWERGKRGSATCGTVETIVSTVEAVSLVHHHAQYLLNATLTGYVIWASGSLDNEHLRAAVERQERFCRATAPLFPTMTPSSWARMERSVKAWFEAALATELFRTGVPSPHYEASLRLLSSPPGALPPRENDPAPPPPARRFDRARPGSTPACARRARAQRGRDGRDGHGSDDLTDAPLVLGGERVDSLGALRRLVAGAARDPAPRAAPPTTLYYTRMDGAPPRLPPRGRRTETLRRRPAAAAPPEDPYLAPYDEDDGRSAYASQHPRAAGAPDDEHVYEYASDSEEPIYEEIPTPRIYQNVLPRPMEAAAEPPVLSSPTSLWVEEENPIYGWGDSPLFSPPPIARGPAPAAPEPAPEPDPEPEPDPDLEPEPPCLPAHRPRTGALDPTGQANLAALSAMLTKLKHDRRHHHSH
ncbi:tegument protein VP11/12 [Macacine alphaherpesvirus 1]|uniref:Tegument phosphoprotein n=1 Tax=Cercopithecine herpesvirus 1 (strain E2490) TaxID=260965 RepID=Q7T5D2_CHV1E|nr:tegument protein VP11/12 [Macacine alphaherpesvirus 1]AAP41464.1 tegument phosphoprotein [Macacine alphaherpesvirus 1]ARS01908.1 tegument protein VP11/12 [Macacine alphaherpesvirus 1]ARS02866.1 tegument protein VP11/12 [Macacine alphaherpesvirus 1]